MIVLVHPVAFELKVSVIVVVVTWFPGSRPGMNGTRTAESLSIMIVRLSRSTGRSR